VNEVEHTGEVEHAREAHPREAHPREAHPREAHPREAGACLRFGWTSLAAWALGGFGLELAHAFKLSMYLDDAATRSLLTLAHAHGVGLALVVLAFGAWGAPLHAHCGAGRLLRAGALFVPVGFALGPIGHTETDPGIGIALVPVGACAVLIALAWTAIRAWRPRI
jgi:hypothetical protein